MCWPYGDGFAQISRRQPRPEFEAPETGLRDIFYSIGRPDTPLEETMGALDFIVRSGRRYTRAFPIISRAGRQARRFFARSARRASFTSVYSMFNRWIEGGLLETLAQEGLVASRSRRWRKDC